MDLVIRCGIRSEYMIGRVISLDDEYRRRSMIVGFKCARKNMLISCFLCHV